MRIDEITRRGLLGAALGAAAGLGLSSQSQAAPYVDRSEMSGEQWTFYEKEIPKLQNRANQILRNLREALAEIDPKNYNKIADVIVEVRYHNQLAGANLRGKVIWIDVTVYYDINDDALASTIGHELGHFVYGTNRYHGNAHQMELDADIYGIKIAQRAGYDIRQAMRGIAEAGEFFRQGGKSHPSYDQRMQAVKKSGFPTAGTGYLQPSQHTMAIHQLRSTAQAINATAQNSAKSK